MMHIAARIRVGIAAVVSTFMLSTGPAFADYPERTVTLILPFAAGGGLDRMTRGLSRHWEKYLGAQIQVKNVPGAGNITGVKTFLASADDGYTILMGTDPYLSTGVFRGGGYKISDFRFVNIQQFDPATLAVQADSPYKTLDDLLAAAKAKPGTVSWGTAVGGAPHIIGTSLFEELKLDARFVPYQSGGPARLAVLGGHIDAVGGTAAADLSALGDKGRLLAIAARKRFAKAPEVPTFNEVLAKHGVTLPYLGSARYVAVHASLPGKHPDRYAKIVESYRQTLESAEYREYMEKAGESDVTQLLTPEEATQQFQEMFATMQKYEKILLGK